MVITSSTYRNVTLEDVSEDQLQQWLADPQKQEVLDTIIESLNGSIAERVHEVYGPGYTLSVKPYVLGEIQDGHLSSATLSYFLRGAQGDPVLELTTTYNIDGVAHASVYGNLDNLNKLEDFFQAHNIEELILHQASGCEKVWQALMMGFSPTDDEQTNFLTGQVLQTIEHLQKLSSIPMPALVSTFLERSAQGITSSAEELRALAQLQERVTLSLYSDLAPVTLPLGAVLFAHTRSDMSLSRADGKTCSSITDLANIPSRYEHRQTECVQFRAHCAKAGISLTGEPITPEGFAKFFPHVDTQSLQSLSEFSHSLTSLPEGCSYVQPPQLVLHFTHAGGERMEQGGALSIYLDALVQSQEGTQGYISVERGVFYPAGPDQRCEVWNDKIEVSPSLQGSGIGKHILGNFKQLWSTLSEATPSFKPQFHLEAVNVGAKIWFRNERVTGGIARGYRPVDIETYHRILDEACHRLELINVEALESVVHSGKAKPKYVNQLKALFSPQDTDSENPHSGALRANSEEEFARLSDALSGLSRRDDLVPLTPEGLLLVQKKNIRPTVKAGQDSPALYKLSDVLFVGQSWEGTSFGNHPDYLNQHSRNAMARRARAQGKENL